jgi:hypothetical protein
MERERKGKEKNKNKKQQKGGGGACDQARGFPFVFSEHLQTLRTWPYLGSIPKIVLHEKTSTKTSKSLDQDPRMNGICNLSKTPTKPTYNIETKTNNTTLAINPNSCA